MTSPATQEPCPKCLGYGGSRPVEDGEWVSCSACNGKSQRAELLTQEQPQKLYADREIRALGQHYLNHMLAMTAERLETKGAIAAELAWRDWQIECERDVRERLEARLAALTQRVEELEPGSECWAALCACARITCMGSAGLHDPAALARPDAHITLNFWTHNVGGDAQDLHGRDMFSRFMEKLMRAKKAALSQEPRNG